MRAGINTGSTVCTLYMDNVRIDDTAMPGPDGAPPAGFAHSQGVIVG